jgi:hypothetical protein
MADKTPNNSDQTPTSDEKSFNNSPRVITKSIMILVAAAILFIIVFAILFMSFLNNPTGGSISNQNKTESRANP